MRARRRSAPSRASIAAVLLLVALSACQRGTDAPPPRPWRVAVVQLDDDADTRALLDGVEAALGESSLQLERDYVLTAYNAHGDPKRLPALINGALRDGAHSLLAIGTAALEAAHAAGARTPIVFTDVADPVQAGVRPPSVWRRWLPFLFSAEGVPVTGAYAQDTFGELLEDSRGVVNGRLGAVVVRSDRDALAYRDALRDAAGERSQAVEFDSVASAAEVGDAAKRLCVHGVVGLIALGDRASNGAFDALQQAALACGIPVFGTLHAHADAGAAIVLARDPIGAAHEAGRMVARLARGEPAADIPIAAIPGTALILNPVAAEKADVGIPFSLVQRADEVLGD
jgi:putative tryptophan/tyrosine transport system substrate-binding protein